MFVLCIHINARSPLSILTNKFQALSPCLVSISIKLRSSSSFLICGPIKMHSFNLSSLKSGETWLRYCYPSPSLIIGFRKFFMTTRLIWRGVKWALFGYSGGTDKFWDSGWNSTFQVKFSIHNVQSLHNCATNKENSNILWITFAVPAKLLKLLHLHHIFIGFFQCDWMGNWLKWF